MGEYVKHAGSTMQSKHINILKLDLRPKTALHWLKNKLTKQMHRYIYYKKHFRRNPLPVYTLPQAGL